jgi:D-alanyl-lipoteichoic acid acyltransferase DltB (MBOAT superfamily)
MVYADPTAFSAPVLWLAVAAFAVQLYCDFSGYSDMALGTAHLLGYRLTWNFNLPFLATSMAEFWRRWHISLSNWIRDYIYIPLGGSRGSAWFNCRNLMLAMIFCGLWHEATAHDLVFGIVQGAILIACRQFRSWYKQRPAVCAFLDSRIGTACSIAFTLFIFSLSLIFFRTPNMSTAWSMFHGLFGLGALGTIPKFNYMLLACLFVIFGIGHWLAQGQRWRRMVDSMPAVAVGTGYTVVATAALILAPGLAKQFIYFQF